jgi:hypothetical protein
MRTRADCGTCPRLAFTRSALLTSSLPAAPSHKHRAPRRACAECTKSRTHACTSADLLCLELMGQYRQFAAAAAVRTSMLRSDLTRPELTVPELHRRCCSCTTLVLMAILFRSWSKRFRQFVAAYLTPL